MKIAIVTPAPPRARNGNRVTAERWRRLLRQLGHDVQIILPENATKTGSLSSTDLLIAVHARKSHSAVASFHERFPDRPIIVAIAGTDLSDDFARNGPRRDQVLASLEVAVRIIALHPLVELELPLELRERVRVLLQSAVPLAHPPERTQRTLDMVVVGHLRAVKDPFLPARALSQLPARSRLRIRHFGRALDPDMLEEARSAMERDPRYRWKGEQPRGEVRQAIARAHALIHPSIAEGGANTVSEALVLGTPVLATAIPGNLGLLGADHPGVFPVGDAAALARLMLRFESEPRFRAILKERCEAIGERHRPEAELGSWQKLLSEIGL